jgi:hypothetical protein
MPLVTKLRFAFDVAIVFLFAGTAYVALDYQARARWMPLIISLLAIVLGVMNLGVDVFRYRKLGTAVGDEALETAALQEDDDVDTPGEAAKRVGRYLLWTVGYAAAIGVFGLMGATGLFLAGFLTVEAKVRPVLVVVSVVVVLGLLYVLSDFMNLQWPENLMEDFVM